MSNTPRNSGDHRPRVRVLFTGGTISMTHAGHDGSAVPTLHGSDIRDAVPGLEEMFQIEGQDFDHLPSPHMTIDRMLELCRAVRQALDDGADGVVVTHGTDTLEETAYLIDLLHHDPRPVVLVGAMRTRDELSWDGPVNLYSACAVAAHPEARGKGVMVVMNNTVNAASEVTKTFTEAVDTFVSPDTGPLGIVDMGQVIIYRKPVRRMVLTAAGVECKPKRVETVVATAGGDGGLVDAAVAGGCAGLVVAAFGRGNVPPAMAEALLQAIAGGVSVVVCSRCWGGRVAPVYGYPGGGARLLQGGAIFAPWHGAPKARIALSLALACGYDHGALCNLFGSPDGRAR